MQLSGQGRYKRGMVAGLMQAGIVPRYPGPELVPPVRVPPPPTLREEHTSAARLELVVRAYRTVMGLLTGKPCKVLARAGQAQSYRYAGQLIEAAGTMAEKGLPPLLWAHWRVAYWYRKDAARKAPPLAWVYKLEPLQKMRWMFCKEYHELLTGISEFAVPAHGELLLRWRLMDETLRRVLPAQLNGAEDLAREIVGDFFSGDLYARLLEQAVAEAETAQNQLHRRARRGEWLWSMEGTIGCKIKTGATD